VTGTSNQGSKLVTTTAFDTTEIVLDFWIDGFRIYRFEISKIVNQKP
jgi:hypothetical protein